MAQKIKFKDILIKCGKYLKSIVFPRGIKCIFCGEELVTDTDIETCELCYNSLPFILNACPKCGGEISENNSGVCTECKINNFSFVRALSVFNYQDSVLKAIHKFKYNGNKYLAKPMARFMAEKFALEDVSVDYLTYVPIHKNKLKERGFNQSKLLSEELSKFINVTTLNLCEKVINTPSQTNLKFSERKANVKDSFKFNSEHKNKIKNKTILIIDDVITTGATTSELCSTILKAGAKHCFVLTLAHVSLQSPTQDN